MPRTIGSISVGTSAGSYSMSASWTTTISPSTCGTAARIAAPLPRFGWWMTTRPAPPAAQRSSSSPVPSQEPSSTTTTCFSSGSASTRSRTSPIVLASLKTGTTKLTRRAGAGGATGASRTSSWRAALTPKWSAVWRETGITQADRRRSTFARWPPPAGGVQWRRMAATRTRAATAPERRSLLDLWPGPIALVGALVAGLTIYLNVKSQSYGFDFRGGEWVAGRDVLAGRSPYPAPDPAHLVAVGNAYIPPPLLAVLSVPLSLLPMVPAAIVLDVVSTAALALALRIVGALAWRYRSSWRGAAAAGLVIALKLLAWPLVLWFVVTRRFRQAGVATAVAVAATAGSWSLIGFEGLSQYPRLLSADATAFQARSRSVVAAAVGLGTTAHAARLLAFLVAAAVAVTVWRLASDRDLGAFAAALAFGLLTIAYWISPTDLPAPVWKIMVVLVVTATLSVLAARRPRPHPALQPAKALPQALPARWA